MADTSSLYVTPYETTYVNGSLPNSQGVSDIPSYPNLLNGTNCADPAVANYKPSSEIDVLIVGGGPVGLTVAASLARQGVSVRILDKSDHPLTVGRADALQPRTMEVFNQLGLAGEVSPMGPLIEHTVVYKDGKKMIFKETHFSPHTEGKFMGLHVVTQTEIEHMLIRDLVRHDILVERPSTATSYELLDDDSISHPIRVNVTNQATGESEIVKARYLVGSDGAHSMIRKSLPIKFDGIKTNLHWGIVDAVFETDFPHRWIFGTVLNSQHGGCLIIPRERDMVRLYVQLWPEPGKEFDPSLWGPEECLAQLNKVYAPYKLAYKGPVDWFTILTINERVASSFTHKDRIFLAGDSCHVHSAKGAFGLNTGTMDAHNLAWKLGALSKGIAKPSLLSTYDVERRENALRAVATSARYLRFVANCTFESIDGSDSTDFEEDKISVLPGEDPHVAFFRNFAEENERFLIGLDVDYRDNVINKPVSGVGKKVRQGYRAPDPRVALSKSVSGRLYDSFGRVDQFKIVVFASNLAGAIVSKVQAFESYLKQEKSFYSKYADVDLFKVVVVVRGTTKHAEESVPAVVPFLGKVGQSVADDQLPVGIFGGDAHSIYGVSHEDGAVVIVRPDLWVGTATTLENVADLESYFSEFLVR